MPSYWSNKEERQYEHIKESARKRGESPRRSKEIAARTVNKQRSRAGKTKHPTADGGNGLENKTKRELYRRAQRLSIHGRSQMNKAQLVRAIRRAG